MKHSWPIIWLNELDSTNNYANSLVAENKLNTETVISTYAQNKGRGQKGNLWESEPNLNITTTVVLYTKYLSIENQFALSQSAALAIKDMFSNFNINAKVKWPNDIFVNNYKIAGILIENSIIGSSFSHSCIGIGINTNQTNFGEFLPKATSMKIVKNLNYNIHEVLETLLNCLNLRLSQLKEKKFDDLNRDYIANLYQFGEWCTYKSNEKIFKGKIINVGKHGELVILSDKGEQHSYLFKEVSFL